MTEGLKLTHRCRQAAWHTNGFRDMRQAYGPLRPLTLYLAKPGGRTSTVHCLMMVEEEVLDTLARVRFRGSVCAHMISLQALDRLSEHTSAKKAAAA